MEPARNNYTAYFVFTGPVDPATGMLINISEIKSAAVKVLRDGFDHKIFKPGQSVGFARFSPTAVRAASQLYFRCGAASERERNVLCHWRNLAKHRLPWFKNL